jgi:hypothetical protein
VATDQVTWTVRRHRKRGATVQGTAQVEFSGSKITAFRLSE